MQIMQLAAMNDPVPAPPGASSPTGDSGGGPRLFIERVEALAAVIDLDIPPQYLAGVAENLERLLAQAKLIGDVELPPGSDAAPVFRP
ncbi:DUF4089 domain-containing protein [Methylocapsa palsarum]|nr:DUF4089 domain-containing protein [Methylocapsa palsarum]